MPCGGGGPVDRDNAPLDPVFKLDRKTGAVLANFGKGVMVTAVAAWAIDNS
jgi:hypothetical protein